MYFGCVCFRGELGFLNCDDIYMCVVNKQFDLLEFVLMARGSVGGEWMRGLGLGFTNPVGTGEVLHVCLCFGCCGVGGEWVGGLDQGLEGWC